MAFGCLVLYKLTAFDRKNCLLVVTVYASTDRSSPEDKDEFYWDLSRLLRTVCPTDLVVVAGDFTVGLSGDEMAHKKPVFRPRRSHR